MIFNTHCAAACLVFFIFICSTKAQTNLKQSGSPSPGNASGQNLSPAEHGPRPIPFHGMVSGVDQKNKTFTISGKEATRIFKVTDKTEIMKGAGKGTLKDITGNEEVSGAYWKNPDGTLEAKMVKIGPAEKKAGTPAPNASMAPKSGQALKTGPTP